MRSVLIVSVLMMRMLTGGAGVVSSRIVSVRTIGVLIVSVRRGGGGSPRVGPWQRACVYGGPADKFFFA